MQEGRHAHNNESTSMNGINFFFVVALLLIVYLTHLIFIYNNKYCLHLQPPLRIMCRTSMSWKMLLISYKGENHINLLILVIFAFVLFEQHL
jgi:hypothetical protein